MDAPRSQKNIWIYFLLNYGMTLNFTILYFMKGHNSGKPK